MTALRPMPRAAAACGAVLLLCLVFLLVLGILGRSAMTTSILEVRVARNQEEVQAAFQAAETALRHGESVVAGFDDDGTTDGAGWQLQGTTSAGTGRYLIERHARLEDADSVTVVFRITARGMSSRGDVAVLLESTYARRWASTEALNLPEGRLSWREVEG